MNKLFSKKTKQNESDNHSINSSSSSKESNVCRICQTEKEPPEFLLKKHKISHENFIELINPCLCSGSMKYVHRECLQHWISSSKAKKCELCLYPFKIKVRLKRLKEWEALPLTSIEQKRICFTVIFQVMAMTCAIWSLAVLINKTMEEIISFKLSWSLWIKLLVIALGLTGLSLFMWIQIRLYLTLLFKWRAHNQEHIVMSPSNKELEEARRQRLKPVCTIVNDLNFPIADNNNSNSEVFNIFEIFRNMNKIGKEERLYDNTQFSSYEQQQLLREQHFTDTPLPEFQIIMPEASIIHIPTISSNNSNNNKIPNEEQKELEGNVIPKLDNSSNLNDDNSPLQGQPSREYI